MEENKPTMVSSEQLEAVTNHYQKVYEVSQRVDARANEIDLKMMRMEELQKERDQIFEDLIALKMANLQDTQWLNSVKPPLDEGQTAKVLPLIINRQGGQDSAA